MKESEQAHLSGLVLLYNRSLITTRGALVQEERKRPWRRSISSARPQPHARGPGVEGQARSPSAVSRR